MPADVTGLSAREAWGRGTDGDVALFRFDQLLPAKFDLELHCFHFASKGRDITVRVGSCLPPPSSVLGRNLQTEGQITKLKLVKRVE